MARPSLSRQALLDPEGFVVRARRAWAWEELVKLGTRARSEMVRYLCLNEILKRTDPVASQAQINATLNGPVVIQWQSSPSPTSPVLSNGHSTTLSSGNGPARPASLSTDALESL